MTDTDRGLVIQLEERTRICSFCGRCAHEIRMVGNANANVWICELCVSAAADIFKKRQEK
jgi:ribosomal protein L37AE/L43A